MGNGFSSATVLSEEPTQYFSPDQLRMMAGQRNGWSLFTPKIPQANPTTVRHFMNNFMIDSKTFVLNMINEDDFVMEFTYDSLIEFVLQFYLVVKETVGQHYETMSLELLPSKVEERRKEPLEIYCPAGMKRVFKSADHSLVFKLSEFVDYSYHPEVEVTSVYPLVICAKYPNCNLFSQLPREDGASTSVLTYLNLEKTESGLLCEIMKQKMHVGRHGYIANEIYGLSEGKDCLICMSAIKNTIILPCRHICLCSECSMALRLQTNKCPVCRAKVESLVRIENNSTDCHSVCSTPMPRISENRLSEIRARLSQTNERLSATNEQQSRHDDRQSTQEVELTTLPPKTNYIAPAPVVNPPASFAKFQQTYIKPIPPKPSTIRSVSNLQTPLSVNDSPYRSIEAVE